MKGPQIITDPPHLSSHVKSGPALVSSCSIGAVKYAIDRIGTEITNHLLCARAGVFPASVNAPLEISAPLTLVPCVCIITTLIRYHRIMEYLRDYFIVHATSSSATCIQHQQVLIFRSVKTRCQTLSFWCPKV